MGFKNWFKAKFGPKLSEIEKETEVHDVALLMVKQKYGNTQDFSLL